MRLLPLLWRCLDFQHPSITIPWEISHRLVMWMDMSLWIKINIGYYMTQHPITSRPTCLINVKQAPLEAEGVPGTALSPDCPIHRGLRRTDRLRFWRCLRQKLQPCISDPRTCWPLFFWTKAWSDRIEFSIFLVNNVPEDFAVLPLAGNLMVSEFLADTLDDDV